MIAQRLHAHWQRSPLAAYWSALAPRDRLALAGLGLFAGAVMVYLLFWQPAQRQAQEARQAFTEQRALYAYLKTHAAQASAHAQTPIERIDPARLQGVVAQSAAQSGVLIERLDSEGEEGVQLSVPALGFTTLMNWLYTLQRRGVQVEQLAVERQDGGLVSARIGLRVAP